MGYRIVYERKKRHLHWWLLLIPAAALLIPAAALLWREGWYEALARYVGAAIYGH